MKERVGEPPWLRELRSGARERFEAMAWPNTSMEEWRRTEVGALDLLSYDSQAKAGDTGGLPTARAGLAGELRFASGACVASSLSASLKERGLRLLPLEAALEEFQNPIRRVLEEASLKIDDRFAAWQLAEWQSGAFVYVPAGLHVEEPLFLDFAEGGGRRLCAPRVIVLLGEGAEATVVERLTESGRGEGGVLCNAALDLRLGAGSTLRYFEAQDLASQSLYFRRATAELERDANLRHFAAELGGHLVKTRIECALNGQGGEAKLDGAYFCGRNQHVDIRTVQRHLSQKGTSRANYRGAVDSGGSAVFQGLIEVGEGASGTDAFLTSKSLILGDSARADSLPTLRIGNNDVRCSHGSTTGRLSDEELFYLESRGFSSEEAREMLVIGYFEDLLGSTPMGYGDEALERIRSRLRKAA